MGQDKSIVILTGAGISAESGLQTFRASDGLWCDHRVEDVATPEAFARDPDLVQQFYNIRRAQLATVQPNAAHEALADLAEQWAGDVMLVTQNVDDLHGRALAARNIGEHFSLIYMHGELTKARHVHSGEVIDWQGDMQADGPWRPHIVWFGEMPLEMARISRALQECDLFMSIGTSGNVYPAAGFVAEAAYHGAHTVELNLEPSLGASLFDAAHYGPATQVVPALVADILAGKII